MKIIEYDRKKSTEYAKKWAYLRNPSYYDYDKIASERRWKYGTDYYGKFSYG